MAKKIMVSAIFITVALLVVACNSENIVNSHVEVPDAEIVDGEIADSDVPKAEETKAEMTNEEEQDMIDTQVSADAKTTVSGSFTVCVRDVIPDYCMDDVTKTVAVVTEFQSNPFTVYVGEEIANQLELGQTYNKCRKTHCFSCGI